MHRAYKVLKNMKLVSYIFQVWIFTENGKNKETPLCFQTVDSILFLKR